MNDIKEYDLIVVIVNKGFAKKVVTIAQKAGARGSTVINGRGSSIHETSKILGVPIEPEKEIILLVVQRESADKVLAEVVDKAELNKSGVGIGFVLEVEKAVGIDMNND